MPICKQWIVAKYADMGVLLPIMLKMPLLDLLMEMEDFVIIDHTSHLERTKVTRLLQRAYVGMSMEHPSLYSKPFHNLVSSQLHKIEGPRQLQQSPLG